MLHKVSSFIKHFFRAEFLSHKKSNKKESHIVNDLILSNSMYYSFLDIDDLRYELLKEKEKIKVNDLGAGSSVTKSEQRRICDITRHSAIPEKYGKILFRLINYFESKTIIELGTSLGIGTMYLATPSSKNKVITIEGSKPSAAFANAIFEEFELNNIELQIGNFDEQLPLTLEAIEKLDFVFFDGNHRYTPTINYFNQCLEKATEKSIFVFDDIYWSKEMTNAWKQIIAHPKVSLSIDLYRMGIVFFDKELQKDKLFVRI